MKTKKGFTLLEAAVGTALWVILAAGAVWLMFYAMRAGERQLAVQSGLENARVAMDSIIANVQMGESVRLVPPGGGLLQSITAYGYDASGRMHPFTHNFRAAQQVLDFPLPGNPIAQGIAAVYIFPHAYHLQITVRTTCEIMLHGAVCIRGKAFLP
jgi:hypothetical protein